MAGQLVFAFPVEGPRCPVCRTPLARVQVSYLPHTITEDCIRAACVRARRAALQALPPCRWCGEALTAHTAVAGAWLCAGGRRSYAPAED